jgi:membrane protein DedA with SNARE-associated domain
MADLAKPEITDLLVRLGYWAIFLAVMVESMGIPFPGETALVTGALLAGTSHQLQIQWVILAAAAGAVAGDNIGYWLGRHGGYWLVRRYGRYVRLDEKRLKVGQYLFRKHGGKIVFFGRFVAVLRTWAAFLAGVNRMDWRAFLACNLAGGVSWALLFGLGGYFLGDQIERFEEYGFRIAIGVGVLTLAGGLLLRHHERSLRARADMEPGAGDLSS